MAANSTYIRATFEGKPLDVLADLIAKREEYFSRTTTREAVTATAINVLTSLRATTKVAKPNDDMFGTRIMPAPGVVAGYKTKDGRKTRIVRENVPNGHELTSVRVMNLAGNYVKGEKVLCFICLFKHQRLLGIIKGDKYERFYVIAHNAGDVKKWANNKLKNYVRKYSGMAKWALGQAQSRIAASGFGGDDVGTTPKARRVALDNLVVNVGGSGFSNGSYFVEVRDKLDYSLVALKNGQSDFQLAIMKAANRTAAIINKLADKGFGEKIPTPFPEIAHKK